jgi:pilus assembly protein CpaE
MKIAAILSSQKMLAAAKEALEKSQNQDQFIFLERKDGDLGIERLDLYSTNILILDSEYANDADMKAVAACVRQNSNPAVILITSDHSEAKLIEYMRSGVSEVIDFPVEGRQLIDAIERLRKKRYIATTYHPRGKILSFISAKGGAGATFIAGNIGYSLATKFNLKVLYIDLNMQFGDAGFYFSETIGGPSIVDIVAQTGLDSSIISSASIQVDKNFNLLQSPDSPDKAAGIKPQHIDNLLTVAIQDYDYVIMDLPRTIDAISMKVLDRSDKIYLVFQPVVPYIRAASKILQLFNQLGYEDRKVGLMINRMDKNLSISQSKVENTLQTAVEWVIPNDFVNCMASTNTGTPLQVHNPSCELAHMFDAIAGSISGGDMKTDKTNFFTKLFKSIWSK